MKIYEFTYTDNENLCKSELLHRIQAFLENEAVFQNWSPGYSFRQSKSADQIAAGTQYFYEVIGRYMDSEGISHRGESVPTGILTNDPAAARESGL